MSASDHMPNLATLVTESQRLAFLPRLFGPHYLHVEAGTYDWMRQLAPDYTGGCWEFMTLSNDGGWWQSARRSRRSGKAMRFSAAQREHSLSTW